MKSVYSLFTSNSSEKLSQSKIEKTNSKKSDCDKIKNIDTITELSLMDLKENMNDSDIQQNKNEEKISMYQLNQSELTNPKDQLNYELNENQMIPIDQLESLSCVENLNNNQKIINESIYSEDKSEFKLKWELRNKLISLINDFTCILIGENIPNKSKKMITESNNLALILFDLTLKLERKHISSTNNDNFRPILILKTTMKNEIINLLNMNKNYAIIYKDIIDKEKKSNLIKSNNALVFKLMSLPIELIPYQTNFSGVEESDSIDYLKDNYYCNQLIEKYDNQIDELKSEIQKLKSNQLINSINTNNNKLCNDEINFFYELKEFSKFSEKDGVRRSPVFRCLNSDWCLKISIFSAKKILQFCIVFFDLKTKSEKKCKINAELSILNQIPDRNNKNQKIENYVYDKRNGRLFQEEYNFLDLKENGFIENNQLVIHLLLKAEWINV